MSVPAMPQATDVVLAGVGFAVASRKREQAGASRRLVGRVAPEGFGAGQLAAFEGNGGWLGLGVGPVLGGAGVEPFPAVEVFGDVLSPSSVPSTTRRVSSLVTNNHAFLGVGVRVYRTATLATAAWAPLTAAFTAAAGVTVTDLLRFQDDLLVLCGQGAGTAIKRLNSTSLVVTDPWVAGEVGLVGVGYRGQAVYAPNLAGSRNRMKLSRLNAAAPPATVFDLRNLDDTIVRMAPFGGKIAIATKSSLFLYAGNWDNVPITAWDLATEPIFSHGAYAGEGEFAFLTGFRGSLYTWVANRVAAYTPGADAGWRLSGPSGRACYGADVAGGYLVVALVADDGGSELWAFDGAGWFRLRREEPGGPVLVWPSAVGGAGNVDLVVFRDGSAAYELVRLVPRTGLPTYGGAAEWRSALLDAGDRGSVKGWVRVGALFAAPGDRGAAGSADPVTVSLDWSLDAGASWREAASRTGGFARSLTLEAALPGGTAGRLLQLRVRWGSVLDWAPVLTGMWADWAIEDAAAARSRWTLELEARDGQIGRDGGKLGQTGRQQLTALWNAWAAGQAVAFRDVDFDANPVERTVTIADIAETTAKGGDAGRWGQGTVKVVLSEA